MMSQAIPVVAQLAHTQRFRQGEHGHTGVGFFANAVDAGPGEGADNEQKNASYGEKGLWNSGWKEALEFAFHFKCRVSIVSVIC
jgi:hypothetical protein